MSDLPDPDSHAYRALILRGRLDALMEASRAEARQPGSMRDWLQTHLDEVKGELSLLGEEMGLGSLPHEEP